MLNSNIVLKEQANIDKVSLKLAQIESFIGDNGSWHLVVDYIAIPNSTQIRKGKEVSAAEWFRLDALPESKEFAHNGWGRSVLAKLTCDLSIPKMNA